jgi:hypothetical protein
MPPFTAGKDACRYAVAVTGFTATTAWAGIRLSNRAALA